MKKFWLLLIFPAVFILMWSLFSDKQTLSENVIRFHVVGASNRDEDQQIKLRVRDSVLNYVQPLVGNADSAQEAEEILADNLEGIAACANEVLRSCGVTDCATVTLMQESFDTREYDTFSLPAGVYESLRITIGEGEGRNWWCVVFPQFCIPATTGGFEDTAVSSGFQPSLSSTLTRKDGYQVRFFLLECIGKLEILLKK